MILGFQFAEGMKKCRFDQRYFSNELIPSRSICHERSAMSLRAFFERHSTVRNYRPLNSFLIQERALRLATELLGEDAALTFEQMERKSLLHLAATILIILELLINETIDSFLEPSNHLHSDITKLCADVFEAEPIDASLRAAKIRVDSATHGIPEAFVDAMLLLTREARRLLGLTGIWTVRGSTFAVMMRDYLCGCHGRYVQLLSWDTYERQRTINSGLPTLAALATYWFCERWEISPAIFNQNTARITQLTYKHAAFAAIGKDLVEFGKYTKGVTMNAVEILRLNRQGVDTDAESCTNSAFLQLINLCNDRLGELVARMAACDTSCDCIVTTGCFQLIRALRILYQQFRMIYDSPQLRKILTIASTDEFCQ